MNLKRIIVLSVVIGTLLLPVLSQAQSKAHRVVFALTSGDEADWKLTVGNIKNLLAAIAPQTAQVEVVSYGPGLNFVKKGSSADADILALEAKQVRFVACENSMRLQHVSATDLIDGVGTVPAGILEVITRQEQGWSYIKAGR